ncbi:sensor domain-containing protein [Saccharomonospora sp. NB11]|uniref:sensor domain-containing protein n=1 Tax=Saccharomonospora sp. NB11 TaxID=1642298 RepID=UPI0018D1DE34|nr:sensor domain-containing protein [Saccharomonospora sp. NB11]
MAGVAPHEQFGDDGGVRPRPSVAGALAYLMLSFPLGLAAFVVLVPLTVAGVGTAIVWVGLPILAIVVLLTRATATLERARTYALLRTYVPKATRPLGDVDLEQRWRTRLADSATWREYAYLLLLLPVGTVEFVLMVATWSVSLALLALPIYYHRLPGGVWHFPFPEGELLTVDSVWTALPWSLLGLLFLVGTAALTRGLGAAHGRFVQVMLGPTRARMRELDEATTALPVHG